MATTARHYITIREETEVKLFNILTKMEIYRVKKAIFLFRTCHFHDSAVMRINVLLTILARSY